MRFRNLWGARFLRVAVRHPATLNLIPEPSGDAIPCKVTPVILHVVVSIGPHGGVSPETLTPERRDPAPLVRPLPGAVPVGALDFYESL